MVNDANLVQSRRLLVTKIDKSVHLDRRGLATVPFGCEPYLKLRATPTTRRSPLTEILRKLFSPSPMVAPNEHTLSMLLKQHATQSG